MLAKSLLRSICPTSSRSCLVNINELRCALRPRTSSRCFSARHSLRDSANEVKDISAFAGKEIWVKDNIVTAEVPTTASSNILDGWQSPYEATVVKLLRDHGAQITGKADLDEFGMGSHSQTSANGAVASPYTRDGVALSPGGSSGGSAVAVATGQCWIALGTDTGGSVRLPAAYLGIVGFKPSYGLLSRWGVIQYANSMDTVGVLSRDVRSARQVFDALNMYDEKDPSSLPLSTRARLHDNRTLARKVKIGVPSEYNVQELAEPVREAWKQLISQLKLAGHDIRNVSLITTRQALSAYYVLAPAEASSNLAKYDGIRYGHRARDVKTDGKLPLYAKARDAGFGAEVKRRILLGAYSLSSAAIDNYFIQAQKIRRLVQQDFDKAFAATNPLLESSDAVKDGVDVLISPTAPTLPPTIEEVRRQSPLEAYMNDVFTVPASLAGLPAISVPVTVPEEYRSSIDSSDMQKAGMQIIGQFGHDQTVLKVAELVEQLHSNTS